MEWSKAKAKAKAQPKVAEGRLAAIRGGGAALTLSRSTGTIYYTTDGNDPRSEGGGLAGSRALSPL